MPLMSISLIFHYDPGLRKVIPDRGTYRLKKSSFGMPFRPAHRFRMVSGGETALVPNTDRMSVLRVGAVFPAQTNAGLV